MEKQIRKRKGQPLEDLEKKSLHLKDSISAIKKEMDRTKGWYPVVPKREGTERRQWQGIRFFPHNAFDWLVFIFAAIAFIAGAILCIGLFSMLWRAVILKKKPPLKTFRENLSLRDDLPSRGNTSQTSEMNQQRIESLRERISEESKNSAFPSEAPLPETLPEVNVQGAAIKADNNEDSNESKSVPLSSPSQAAHLAAADLKKRILKAASEGTDCAEISKKFHVSADQVSLILRISQQEGE